MEHQKGIVMTQIRNYGQKPRAGDIYSYTISGPITMVVVTYVGSMVVFKQEGMEKESCCLLESFQNNYTKVGIGNILRPLGFNHSMGDNLRKKSGANWSGKVVGFYSTELTPEGYSIESEQESGSVQIYPLKALEIL